MPEVIPRYLLAPCGMNCMVCYKHLKDKRPCEGCLSSDINKPDSCKACRIKECVNKKGLSYCYECMDFPCKSINNLEKSYNKRYKTSILENSMIVKVKGIEAFQADERSNWTCKKCLGVISLHDRICSECKEEYEAEI